MFWDVYGLNYFDVMRLPYVLFEQMADALEKYQQKVRREQEKTRRGRG